MNKIAITQPLVRRSQRAPYATNELSSRWLDHLPTEMLVLLLRNRVNIARPHEQKYHRWCEQNCTGFFVVDGEGAILFEKSDDLELFLLGNV